MYPSIFGIAVYHPMLILANLSSTVFVLYLIRRDGTSIRSVLGYVLAVQLVGSFLGAKIASILIDGWAVAGFQGGGWRYPGAIVGVLVLGFLLRRWLPSGLSLPRFYDLFAPAFALANAVGALGCFLNGCCHGSVCSLPWAVRYPRGSEAWYQTIMSGDVGLAATMSAAVHPLPLYRIVLDSVLLIVCLRMLKTRRYDGQVMLVFLAAHCTVKAGLELLRFEYDPVHHLIGLVGIGALALLISQALRRPGQLRAPHKLQLP